MNPRYKTTLVTGASSGIGREMALWWAARGSTVYAAARRLPLLEELAARGEGRIIPVALDVTREGEAVERIQALDDECGGLELVVANAGVGQPTPGDRAAWRDVERVLRVNVMGAAATLTAVLPRMVKRGQGHVVGISSVAGYLGLGDHSSYSASKAFLSTFLESLRVDLVGTGVKVTTIEPGFVKSELTAKNEGKVPMPFIADTHVAAAKFCQAISRGARRCVYPQVHGVASRLASWIPAAIYEPVAHKISKDQRKLLESGES